MNVRWVGAERTVYDLVGGSDWFYGYFLMYLPVSGSISMAHYHGGDGRMTYWETRIFILHAMMAIIALER